MPLLPATDSLKPTSSSGANIVENTFPTSKSLETTIDGPEGCMFQSLTCLSVDPVAMKPGMVGLMSKDDTDSSCA